MRRPATDLHDRRQLVPGIPDLFRIAPEQVVEACVSSALATVGARR